MKQLLFTVTFVMEVKGMKLTAEDINARSIINKIAIKGHVNVSNHELLLDPIISIIDPYGKDTQVSFAYPYQSGAPKPIVKVSNYMLKDSDPLRITFDAFFGQHTVQYQIDHHHEAATWSGYILEKDEIMYVLTGIMHERDQ